MKRIGQFFVVGLLCVATQTSAYAISVVSDALSAKWGYTKAKSITSAGGRGEFIIDGYLSLGSRGSHGDEGAIVGVIAQQLLSMVVGFVSIIYNVETGKEISCPGYYTIVHMGMRIQSAHGCVKKAILVRIVKSSIQKMAAKRM